MKERNINEPDLTLNKSDVWVPVIPLPYFYGFRMKRAKCDCGRKFRNRQRYSEHYAYEHIVMGVKIEMYPYPGRHLGKK